MKKRIPNHLQAEYARLAEARALMKSMRPNRAKSPYGQSVRRDVLVLTPEPAVLDQKRFGVSSMIKKLAGAGIEVTCLKSGQLLVVSESPIPTDTVSAITKHGIAIHRHLQLQQWKRKSK